jgi:hypothetical protein
MEHFIELTVADIYPLLQRPADTEERVRVRGDGRVTLASGEFFAVVEGWTGAGEERGELAHLAYILGETVRSPAEGEGETDFIEVEFGRIKIFLRVPEGSDAPVHLHSDGVLTLPPGSRPLGRIRDWEGEDIWKLEQFARRFDAEILTEPEEGGSVGLEADIEEEEIDFW